MRVGIRLSLFHPGLTLVLLKCAIARVAFLQARPRQNPSLELRGSLLPTQRRCGLARIARTDHRNGNTLNFSSTTEAFLGLKLMLP